MVWAGAKDKIARLEGEEMKSLGIIGGTSWESTLEYYRLINEGVRDALGGLHSARIVLASVDFQGYADDMASGRWENVEAGLLGETDRLVAAGIDAILIASNTLHAYAESVSGRAALPFLHIADATGSAIEKTGARRVALLGTRYAMEKGFYQERLKKRFGVEALIPEEADRLEINRIIFDELCVGVFLESSKRRLLEIIRRMEGDGIEAVILGCTELPLLVKKSDLDLPLLDTLGLHAAQAVEFLLAK